MLSFASPPVHRQIAKTAETATKTPAPFMAAIMARARLVPRRSHINGEAIRNRRPPPTIAPPHPMTKKAIT